MDNIKQLLNQLYETLDGYNILNPKNNTNVSLTYGEILPESVNKLFDNLQLNKEDIFYDLGSGAGKVVFNVFFNYNITKCVGIEYYYDRFNISTKYLQLFNQIYNNNFQIKNKCQEIHFICSNIINENILDATIVYLCSTCYSKKLMKSIYNKLLQCKNIRYILTLKDYSKFLNILNNKKIINISTSWNNNTYCYVYYLVNK